ncbi:MAG: Fructokinase [uncultured Gemmatimonadetes bacterium]|uniref:Fructokinase n=1 Tax=uncultured Gemmatimonadota bacterium TaxID=203437 RepID=A0A6J4MKL9_9BACT|nr:MAG: Fructokinase [uncultured Gemmatimonadota bacterium]
MTGAPVICFGEALWDRLPGGLFLGGAPVNVAYHLERCGASAVPVTAVGDDDLGREMLRRFARWGLDTRFVGVLGHRPTGVVHAEPLPDGGTSYRIEEDAAWDWIELSPALRRTAGACRAVVFGTLAQRFPHNRERLAHLLKCAGGALRVYDVNLRPPYDSLELVWRLAGRAGLIKANADELARLTGVAPGAGSLEEGARALAEKTACPRVCVTAGAIGAGLLLDRAWHWAEGRPVHVRDTVGAGDAFLAGLIHGLLDDPGAPRQALERACRLGELVASCEGATPEYTISAAGVPVPATAPPGEAQRLGDAGEMR